MFGKAIFGPLIESICARIRQRVWELMSGEMEAATGEPLDEISADAPKALPSPKKGR
jgi:hypothetical protein